MPIFAVDPMVGRMESIAPLIGYVALAVTCYGFSLANDERLKRLNLAGCLLWALHYGLIGQFTATMMMLLAAVLVSCSILNRPRMTNGLWLLNLVLAPAVTLSALSGQAHWASALPVIGSLLINTGVSKCSGLRMTGLIMAGHMLWIATSLMMGSIPSAIANAMNVGALVLREVNRRKLLPAADAALQSS